MTARLRLNSKVPTWARLKITASADRAPFLVAPKDRMSTPARQVISAGLSPLAAIALAIAAVHVQGQAMTMGDVDGANFIDAIAGAGLGQLGDADRRR